jgi:glycine/D-amino acid oxidase-like deaminating enzyme
VIGTTTAYYLAKDFGISCTLIDPTGTVAPAASGKAGGFLALDWNDQSAVGPLSRRSFDLHQEIANAVGASKIQYRRLTCAAITVNPSISQSTRPPSGKKLDGVEWANGSTVMGMRSLGNEETIAQVHPKMLCDSLFEATKELASDTQIVQGKVVSAVFDESSSSGKKKLIGAKLDDGSVVEADVLLFACGPWTSNLMTGVKYHSVVVKTTNVLSQCVFFSGAGDPEVYVRPDATAYCTGFPDAPVQVTEQPGQEAVRPDAIQRIRHAVQEASATSWLSSSLMGNVDATTATSSSDDTDVDDDTTVSESACYLPSTPDGVPLMGPLGEEDHPGCYVAAGHSCWGILMGPASGESMAHLIATGKSPHVDLRPFEPTRFGTKFTMVPNIS